MLASVVSLRLLPHGIDREKACLENEMDSSQVLLLPQVSFISSAYLAGFDADQVFPQSIRHASCDYRQRNSRSLKVFLR